MMSRLTDRVRVGERLVGGVLVPRLPGRAGEVVDLPVLVVADQRRVLIERLAGVDHGRQRVVVDLDQLQRVAGRVLVGRDHARDLLVLEAHLVAGQDGLRVVGDRRHPREAERLQVLGRDHRGDVRGRERGAGVDRVDLRVRERAAQDRGVEHPGRRMSSRYVPLPRMKRASSLRLSRPKPIGRSSIAVIAVPPCNPPGWLPPPRTPLLGRPIALPRRCSCSPCSGRSRRRSPSGFRARTGRGSRPAVPSSS